MDDVGVAVFAYNRQNHLNRVLERLEENDIKHLYVFIDGPQDEQDERQVTAVADTVAAIDWCATTVVRRGKNLGLAASLTRGIDRVFEDHDRIVVLEDDCVPASNFISFIRASLDRYETNGSVMNVNGYSPPIGLTADYQHDVYFTRRNTSWGWGTWKEAWEHFEYEALTLAGLEEKKSEVRQVTKPAGTDLYPMLRQQLRGDIDSWAVWWSYAIARNDGLCVNPVGSKVSNIGHDGTGTHEQNSARFDVKLNERPVKAIQWPDEPFVDERINNRYRQLVSGVDDRVIKQVGKAILARFGLLDTVRDLRSS